ncbi:MAG TPA: type IV pilin protein [Steroidobacteraceae bacterium]|jgi:type IV pilus assembly protein PilE|nr:type IV pilin protein [Steroidobacteraceae bacterium]
MPRPTAVPPSRQRGMTLIEVMIVVVIVAILASIAVPSYRNYVLRTHRTEARTALLALSAQQEKFYVQNNRYADTAEIDDAPPSGLGMPTTTENGWYTIAIVDGDAEGYSATATATGGQADDTHCASFSIDEAGVKDATNDDCWD